MTDAMRALSLTLLLLVTALPSVAQDAAPAPFDLEGYWAGAYVRGTSVQRVHATVEVVDDTARIALTNEDWVYFGGRRPAPVTRTDDGRLAFDTHYGPATIEADSTFRELIGTVGDDEPEITLHLKKSPPPPLPPPPSETAVTFQSVEATLHGTVVVPADVGPHPALVFVPGRGCATRGGGLRRLRWLARYGFVGLAYDNRGAGTSDGDCKTTTLATESRDIRAALQVLAERDDVDATRIGLWGNSAAGWYVPHAATRSNVPVGFIVTKVGPATSVEAQQKDNASYIAAEMDLSPADSTTMLRYVDLMFADDRPNEAVFAEMQALLAHGEATGWADRFLVRNPDIGDVPATAAGLDSLWVRRYDYDPAADLRQLDVPFLAFFGENDRITPPAENVPRLRQLLSEEGAAPFRIVVVPEAGHGLGQGSRVRTLSTDRRGLAPYYWKFYNVAPDYLSTLLAFLESQVYRSDR
jgi:pimeloyl-ACP methyl ester carboxylesterase